jgi:hypothetical protein
MDIQDFRKREPSADDLNTIRDLHSRGWKAPAIASGIEMNVRTVKQAIRGLEQPKPKPTRKENIAEEEIDQAMRGRTQIVGGRL